VVIRFAMNTEAIVAARSMSRRLGIRSVGRDVSTNATGKMLSIGSFLITLKKNPRTAPPKNPTRKNTIDLSRYAKSVTPGFEVDFR
jgi:hypothetical protein